eukprot:TRINITY_DN7599_c0_g1_i14.p1 TRINITY_DN7599_c0_g1~~TRINITY_DN7599_c0_g1_i14.p1  ORF type:complete len:213 (+),score=85.87 TRINITY_DN7599_c0_g1_i14:30-641(+)
MIRRPPRSTRKESSAASDVYKRQIFVMAGENAEGVMSACEKYEIKEDRWRRMPSMNRKRCGLSCCTVGGWIYAGFGWDQTNLSSVERLETEGSEEWELVRLGKKLAVEGVQVAGMAAVSGSEVLVFGGYKETEELTTDAFILNIKDNVVRRVSGLARPEAFLSSEIRRVDDTVYSFGYTKGGLHKYDIAKDKWTFVAQDKIPK